MSWLEKKEIVLSKHPDLSDADDVYFALPKEDPTSPVAVHMDRDVWDEFGNPMTITATIQPGDTLNKEV